MNITYSNKDKIGDLYLHDFIIIDFNFNDLDKIIKMQVRSEYLKKQINFKFLNVMFCEIFTIEKYSDSTDIIDWYELPEKKELIDLKNNIHPVGIIFVKALMDTIKIYCEKIEVEKVMWFVWIR